MKRFAFLLLLLCCSLTFAEKGKVRSKHVGVSLGYGTSAPSQAGIEVHVIPVSFLKLSFDAGTTVRDGDVAGLGAATRDSR